MSQSTNHYDVLIIGAGVSGMYAVYHLRGMGLSVRAYDGASDVGGTWWYNRYPGARIDGPGSPFYCYSFSDELMQEHDWTETQSTQADVLGYIEHAADHLDVRRDMQFNTWIQDARYDESTQRWTIETDKGERASAPFLVCALGALSTTNRPDIPGIDDFAGECYHTGLWPHEPVSFKGKRVGVIGTGSSGVQSIPEIAKEADHVTVFQRTPQFAFPARNRPLEAEELADARENWDALREKMYAHPSGMPFDFEMRSAVNDTPEERIALFERLWKVGGFGILTGNYIDLVSSEEANDSFADFVRGKIRDVVDDPAIADKLMPDHYIVTKRPILEDGYFEAYNRDNVTLVDLRDDSIERFTKDGAITEKGEHPLDILVLATGYDAISGSMLRLNPKGRGGVSLKERWKDGFHNFLGLTVSGFPNLFMIHGPGSPGVFYNMPFGAERQTNWIGDCVKHLREQGMGAIEANLGDEESWGKEVAAIADSTLFPKTESWWTGANIPGKPRQFNAHLGAMDYFQRLLEVAEKGFEGFTLEKARNE